MTSLRSGAGRAGPVEELGQLGHHAGDRVGRRGMGRDDPVAIGGIDDARARECTSAGPVTQIGYPPRSRSSIRIFAISANGYGQHAPGEDVLKKLVEETGGRLYSPLENLAGAAYATNIGIQGRRGNDEP